MHRAQPTRTAHTACADFRQADRLSRRTLLRAGGAGLLGLTTPAILKAADQAVTVNHPKAKVKNIIFLFQWGGPSHIDMFDMKPDAPEAYRGPHRGAKTSLPGLHINDRLPRLAKWMDRFTLIRSMTHTMKNHNSAGYYALTGHAPATDDQRLRDSPDLWPAYGSVLDHCLSRPDGRHPSAVDVPTEPGGVMPRFVSYPHTIADGSKTPGQHASFLGKKHDPLFIPNDPNDPSFSLPELSLPDGLSVDRLQHRRGLQQLVDQQSRLLDYAGQARGLDAYYEKALGMLQSDQVRSAFDLSQEPAELRDAYGRTTYGQGCLLARRLVESGVRVVTVYFSRSIGGRSKTEGGWDTHGFDNTRMFPIIEAYHLPITDHTLPTLLEDMDQRGLLNETLVLWMGEFGRTPKINKNKSRDHWPQCYTTLMTGAGVKPGYIHGASDKVGAYPDKDPVRLEDLAATLYHLMGVSADTEVHDKEGRPLAITPGKPVYDVMT